MCLFSFTADDKGGMGVAAEERTGGKGAETAGEARQRGETDSRRIESKKKYILHDSIRNIYAVYTKLSIRVVIQLSIPHLLNVYVKCVSTL